MQSICGTQYNIRDHFLLKLGQVKCRTWKCKTVVLRLLAVSVQNDEICTGSLCLKIAHLACYRVNMCWLLIFDRNVNKATHTHTHTHDRFTALCPGLPGWAGTRRNIHPLTPVLLINHPYHLPPSTTNHTIILAQSTYIYILGNLSA